MFVGQGATSLDAVERTLFSPARSALLRI